MPRLPTETVLTSAPQEWVFNRIASLNADGSQKWFIPPYIIPFALVLLVVVRGISLS